MSERFRKPAAWGFIALVLAVVLFDSAHDRAGDEPRIEPARGATRAPACTRTVGPGIRLAPVLSLARPGAAVCLRPGRYPGQRVPAGATDFARTVTVRAVGPGAAVFGGEVAFEGARRLRLVGLAFRAGLRFSPAASRVRVLRCDFSGEGGIFLHGDPGLGGAVRGVLIGGNRIHDIDYRGPQGDYAGYGVKGIGVHSAVTLRGNTIARVAADYVQTDFADRWRVLGNTFRGPSPAGSHPGEHQDLWQVYAGGRGMVFAGNVARGTGTSQSLLFQLTWPGDRFAGVRVHDNLFVRDSRGYSCQIYQADGLVLARNTVVGSRYGCALRRDGRYPDGSGYRVERNVFVATAAGADMGLEAGVRGWGLFARNVTGDRSAVGAGSVRRWRPRWRDRHDYAPLGLPFAAGYRSSRARAAGTDSRAGPSASSRE